MWEDGWGKTEALEPLVNMISRKEFLIMKDVDKSKEQLISELVEMRKRVEEVLQDSEERFKQFFDNEPNYCYMISPEGTILDVNQPAIKVLGYKKEQLVGKPLLTIYAPESILKAKQLFEKWKRTGILKDEELTIIPKNGNRRTVLLGVNAAKDKEGKLLHSVSVQVDITERKKMAHNINERVKELQCFYDIADIIERPRITLTEIFQGIVNILPNSWQYPESTCARINFGNKEFGTDNFKITEWVQSADINVNGKQEGTLEVYYLEERTEIDEGPFLKEERLLINAIAERLGEVTERKRTVEELERSHKRSRRLSAHLQAVREEERKSIAREIHDEFGQGLSVLKMDLAWLGKRLPNGEKLLPEKIKTMSESIDMHIRAVKNISSRLRPGVLDDLGIAAAIDWQSVEFRERTGIKCKVDLESKDYTLDEKTATAIFRIFQEILTNVSRHANATRVKVSLKEDTNRLVLKVRDNGIGISGEQITSSKSFGLMGIKERTDFVAGDITIKGIQGEGTTVTLRVPLDGKRETH
ncbi:PAS domain S-box protein [Chloroflexota bacterium]